MRPIFYILLGIALGAGVTSYALPQKYESYGYDAKSVVIYGYATGTSTLVPLDVDSSGVVQLH